MSLSQLQEATAALVRFPEQGRHDAWEHFVSRFQLTADEQFMLHHIAHNVQVMKYGRKLRYFRFSDTIESLPSIEALLGTQLFEKLWFDHFEPSAGCVATENLTLDFLNFLREDSQTIDLLKDEAPEFATDFVNFLYFETSMEEHGDAWMKKTLPEGSLLNHGAVCPLELNCDVPQLLKDIADNKFDREGLQRKKVYYVLALKEEASLPSLFAIDKNVYQFLFNQLHSPQETSDLPAVYKNLIKAGICRPKDS